MIPPRKRAFNFIAIGIAFFLCLGGILYFVLSLQEAKPYKSLSEVKAYAKNLPESPKSDNISWQDPGFDTFYKERAPNIFSRILRKLGLLSAEPWTPHYLSKLIFKITDQGSSSTTGDGKKKFFYLNSTKDTQIYAFSNVQGGFHGLLNQLDYLRQLGDLNDDFTVKNEQTYLIFLGNVIGRNAYNIDTLTLVLTLMDANPKNVFYLGGRQERDSYWLDYCLKGELVYRAKAPSPKTIPYQQDIDKFFKSRPEALYLGNNNDSFQVIRLSHNKKGGLTFDETDLSGDFLQQTERIKAHFFKPKTVDEKPIDVRATVSSESWIALFRIRHGFGLVTQDQGATAWDVESPQAFARIKAGEHITDTTITGIFSSEKDKSITEGPIDNIIWGKPSPYKPSTKTVKVASSMSLLKGVPTLGQQARIGLNFGFESFNTSMDNQDIFIRLYIDNDNYTPLLARRNVEKYLDLKIPFIIAPTGTPTGEAILKAINGKDAVLLFPISGAIEWRNAQLKNVIHLRASYRDEVLVLLKEMREERAATKFAFFYQDDLFGIPLFELAVQQLERAGLKEYLGIPYTRGSVDFDEQIKALEEFKPDALGFFSTALSASEFISQMGVAEIESTNLFAISFAASVALRRFAQERGLKMAFGAVVPNPKTSPIAIAQEYRKYVDVFNEAYDTFSFETFIASKIFVDVIKKLGPKRINQKNVMAELESIKNLDFYGYNLDFNPQTRTLATTVWINNGDDTTWKSIPLKAITSK